MHRRTGIGVLVLALGLLGGCDSGGGGGALEPDVSDPGPDTIAPGTDTVTPEDVPTAADVAEDVAPEELPCTPSCEACAVDDGCGGLCPTELPCDDGDPCTYEDQCDAGECVGMLLDCADANPCTDDVCDGETGACVHATGPADGLACDDGNPCTGDDVCLDGGCAGATLPPAELSQMDCLCEDDEACENIEDGNLCNGTLVCAAEGGGAGTCEVDPASILSCDDGVSCTVDSCDPVDGCVFAPAHSLCEDGNACTEQVCDLAIGCSNPPLPDGTACAFGFECQAGECVCAPNCDGKECGDDGCGGSCGACGCGEVCDSDLCLFDACDGAVCGDDGCGGSCGACSEGEICEAGACIEDSPSCAPPGPYGTSIGDVPADAVVMDCDGVEYSIHELCNYQATWIYVFAGW